MNLKLAIWDKLEFEIVYTEFTKSFSFLAFSFLFLLIAKKDIKYVNLLVFVHFAICIFAFLQHPLSPFASQMLEIKRFLYSSAESDRILGKLKTEGVYIDGGYGGRFRLAGPFVTSINFAYFAISSVIINFYLYLKYKKRIYLFYLAVLLVASFFTQTRSLLLAEIILIFGFLFFGPFKKQGLYKMAIVLGLSMALLFVYFGKDYLSTGDSRITKISDGQHGDGRPLLWLTAAHTVVNYPFGITAENYMEVKKEMFIRYGHPIILTMPSHNGLINIGFQYSFLGYILFFFLVIFLLHFINLLEPKYAVFFKLALVAYLINAFFHNNFVLSEDYTFYLVLMLIPLNMYTENNLLEKNDQIGTEKNMIEI
ncbi:O-antigen ligase family protein [Ulvibacterium marinum]|uniref:O-antigen ligase family protein n=1 Tax=Ulvibacterium marinum TaxID=2419782 RepID=UPI0024954489|nr:O-antigen ligase family protein [Ulvibacterium marinum]